MFEFIQRLSCFSSKSSQKRSKNPPQKANTYCPYCNRLMPMNVLSSHIEKDCSVKARRERNQTTSLTSSTSTHERSGRSRVYTLSPTENDSSSKLQQNFLDDDEVFQGFTLDELIKRIKQLKKEERIQVEKRFVERYYKRDTRNVYAIDRAWLKQYTDLLSGVPVEIGPIDNTTASKFLRTSQQSEYYLLINEHIWNFFAKLYGGGPTLKMTDEEAENERYLDVTANTSTATASTMRLSKSSSNFSPQEIKSSCLPPFGLSNELYYCYLNSVLQCLMNITPFCESLQQSYKLKGGKWTRGCREIANYKPNQAHALVYAVNTLPTKKHKELNFPNSEAAWVYYQKYHYSCIDQTFAGQIESKVYCKSCGAVSTTYDPILDLSLPLVEGADRLEDCIDNFFKEEALPDSYQCEKCKKAAKAVKKMLISKLPTVMVLHLKRFKTFPKQRKISSHVSFPVETLTFKKTVCAEVEPNKYSLRGIVVHSGTFHSGHYVAFVKRQNDWYLCDDDVIKRVSSKDIANQEAYMLFYQRVD